MSRILVVDDDTSLAWIARASLQRFGGHEVETASSASAALAILAERSFDAVLLDAMMPGRDGGSVLEALRAIGDHTTPVIMLTARIADDDRARYAALGARGVIAKPFDPRTLAREIAKILEESR